MSAELQAEITRLTAELQKISRIWDIAHEFQERHIARMEEENRGQRAEIIELKAQRDCDREAIANYERMVGDHQGRAAAEVERLEMELEKQAATLEEELDRWRVTHADDEPSWKHAAWNRGKERDQARAEVERLKGERDALRVAIAGNSGMPSDGSNDWWVGVAERMRQNEWTIREHAIERNKRGDCEDKLAGAEERLSLAEKLAEAVKARRASEESGHWGDSVFYMLKTSRHNWNEERRALDAFISSGRGEGEKRETDPTKLYCIECGYPQSSDDHEVGCHEGARVEGSRYKALPPAQPSKDPGEDRIGGGLIIEPADRPYETVGDWAMANARKEVAARLTSLEEENAATKIVNSALNAECMGLKAGNAKLRAFRDAAARDIRHRHNHWIDGRECYTCCEPWPCLPIATLDATEGEPTAEPCVLCTLKACPDPTHKGYAR